MFISVPLLIAIALVVLGALVLAFRPRGRSNDLLGPPSRLRSSGQMPAPAPTAAYEARLRALVDAGEIIQAVKLVKDTTGLGLAESKAVVDGMR